MNTSRYGFKKLFGIAYLQRRKEARLQRRTINCDDFFSASLFFDGDPYVAWAYDHLDLANVVHLCGGLREFELPPVALLHKASSIVL